VTRWVLGAMLAHGLASLAFTALVVPRHKAVRSDAVFEQAPDHIEVLVTGDSHPRTAIDPRSLGPVTVNVALGGQHLVKAWYRTRALVEATDRRVDVLILPLDPVSLTGWNAEQYGPEAVWGRYVDFLEVGRVRGRPLHYLGLWLEAHVAPYTGELRTLNQIRTRRYGFGAGVSTASFGALPLAKRLRLAATDARAHTAGAHVDPTALWALQQLLDWADDRGIRVVFVRFPVTRAYARHLGPARAAIDRHVIGPVIDPKRHTILDHEGLFFGRDRLFSDPHHLNAAGRARYTRWLGRVLARRGLIDGAAADAPPGER